MRSALEGDAQDAVGLLQMLRVLGAYVAEEAVNGRQPHIARGAPVSAASFEVSEEGGDGGGIEIGDCEISHLALFPGGKLQQELEAVTITQDGLGTIGALVG